jgi:hypothetical protein
MLRERALIPIAPVEQQLRLLLEAFSSEAQRILDYLEVEYFEDVTDDPRFESLNQLLSLYMLWKSDPKDPNLARFFSELERDKGSTNAGETDLRKH